MLNHSLFPKKVVTVSRFLLGFMFFVFGLNGFFHFLPQPAMPEQAAQFMGALVQSGYMMPLVFAVQLFAGISLLANRFVPLALILLVPVIVNIIGFHLSLAPASIVPGVVAAVLNLYLLVAYLPAYKPMLRVQPTRPES
ncbi:hypothetical protein [Fodinibius salsisoli]|uniref:DoxX protein n=1 Tax=Fodinibius salsisoli TaxID=2820877 RepID=A0ABT3PHW8_9BACT|nr:hypothetical protein [Fodinibius salsisoli]MCW9705509.1 hypothetical protein [Fodinibius salsisoli]